MLKDKIDFNILDNDIVSYFPLDLSDISAKPIKEVISGQIIVYYLRIFNYCVVSINMMMLHLGIVKYRIESNKVY